jgi:hypothetical protein
MVRYRNKNCQGNIEIMCTNRVLVCSQVSPLGFGVDKVAVGQVFLFSFCVSTLVFLINIIPLVLHACIHSCTIDGILSWHLSALLNPCDNINLMLITNIVLSPVHSH